MASTTKELAFKGVPLIRIYKDGKVERLRGYPYVPPSPDKDPETGVSSKDITISHNPNISARLYLPNLPQNQIQKLPILVYFHGGAFCVGSAFSLNYHRFLNRWSQKPKLQLSLLSTGLPQKTHFLLLMKIPGLLFNGTGELVWWCESFGCISVPPLFLGIKPIGSEPKGEDFENTLEYKAWDVVYPSAPGGIDNPMVNPAGEGARAWLDSGALSCLCVLQAKIS
ncbi:CXE carboxylesterase [Prunus yedoensis var. nudiflora]|uniref:CXE carboxylesterase n=1 Tax=Prunus yedoensis var. nudiflora TaxID=2094558 RepID=A0A315B5M5_PRUYE|nr:CXE carboxylesterase [Prunus yedoensis var. nudiflora]